MSSKVEKRGTVSVTARRRRLPGDHYEALARHVEKEAKAK